MSSQFRLYSSSDVSGPGLLTGAAGTLLALLDACLVNGYSGKAAAGWTKPFSNSGNIGCYKQGAGALMSLLINDNGPNVTSTYKEAWMTGWESIAGIGAPVGTGSGQFPTPAQLLTTGHVVCRKSATADATGRSWQLYADATTFYLFIATGDATGTYYPVMFGDVFSMAGSSDAYRCLIIGRAVENSTGPGTVTNTSGIPAGNDQFDGYLINGGVSGFTYTPSLAEVGHFMPRSWGGTGTSILIGKVGDLGKSSSNNNAGGGVSVAWLAFTGVITYPNGPDGSLYMSPIWIFETASSLIRGRWRGLYHVCHAIGAFTDGQTFSGAGDYAGKSFTIIKTLQGGGFLAVETSATVETN